MLNVDVLSVLMLNAGMLGVITECRCVECPYAKCCYAEWHCAKCCYAERRYAERHYAKSCYAKCHYAERRYVVTVLSVIMLNVAMVSVLC
jgi:hypothetical protein